MYVRQNINDFEQNKTISRAMKTRHRESLAIPVHRSAAFAKGAGYMAISAYNKLPTDLKHVKSATLFKRQLKEFFLDTPFYSINEYLYEDQ
jgi:hypothetical protein